MKFPIAVVAYLFAITSVDAFVPQQKRTFVGQQQQQLSAVVTGPGGKAASSFEEDLQLTLKIIMDHEARSTTVSKEQFLSQMEELKEKEAEPEPEVIDVSVPYDAAAKLAYEASDKSMDYDSFKTKYEADAVADVIAKQPIDVSIPYDAAAKLAYEASDKSMDYPAFKTKFEADAVADVIAKQPIDVSIPYDAAAKLAYEASDKSMDYPAFKTKFEADAVADVIAKQPKKEKPAAEPAPAPATAAPAATADVSIPYDAAAKLAYEASDKSMDYESFKSKFEADAVADVVAKREAKSAVAA